MTTFIYPWRRKHWHSSAGRIARIKSTILIALGHETEICGLCGGKVGVVWWCEEALWERLTGWPDGEGVACIGCFDDLAAREGLIFQWVPRPLL